MQMDEDGSRQTDRRGEGDARNNSSAAVLGGASEAQPANLSQERSVWRGKTSHTIRLIEGDEGRSLTPTSHLPLPAPSAAICVGRE